MLNHRTIGVLATVAVLAGCDDSLGTAPVTLNEEVDLTAALVAADGTLEDLAAMNATLPSGPSGVSVNGNGAGMGGMLGGMMGRGDLVREWSRTYFDAAGVEQDAYDALTTASIHTLMTLEGGISRDGFEATLARSRDMWVSGLEGEETTRTWDGSGTESHTRSRMSDELGTRSYEMEGDFTIEGVVRAVDRVAQPYPLAGTITRHVRVTIVGGPNGDVTRERTVVITFDGTQFAHLMVGGEEFDVDLAVRDSQRPISHRRGQGDGHGMGHGMGHGG